MLTSNCALKFNFLLQKNGKWIAKKQMLRLECNKITKDHPLLHEDLPKMTIYDHAFRADGHCELIIIKAQGRFKIIKALSFRKTD